MNARRTRAEKQAETRQALVDAGERVFLQRGFVGASVEAIAAEAGFTRGAFYSNFRTKEELFAELLQQRAFSVYRAMAAESAEGGGTSLRETGERLAEIQRDENGQGLFRLWLELLAHAGRDDEFRKIAAEFWRGTRRFSAEAIRNAHEGAGAEPPENAEWLATAMIALDIGLALQHFIDPEQVPLEVYPALYELLFSPLAPSAVAGA